MLARYPWPGNVRQLRNVIESVVVFHQGEEVQPADLPVEVRDSASVSTSGGPVQSVVGEPRTMADIERQAILETLERTGGHRAKAADLLGIGLRTLQRKLKEYKDEGFYRRSRGGTMELPAEVLIHNELLGIKGGKGTLLQVSPTAITRSTARSASGSTARCSRSTARSSSSRQPEDLTRVDLEIER